MAERRIIMNNKVENFEWHSLLDLSGKGLHKFNAVGKDMTCSQLMNNAGLDWNVEMKEVHFQDNKGRYIDNYNGDKKLYSLVKDDKQILVSDAIKHLLVSLYQKESNPQSIIDLKNWDESSSKVEYTLKNQEPAIMGLNYLMSKYESKTHDMGILTKNRGLYQLNSLDKLIKQASTKNNAPIWSKLAKLILKPGSAKNVNIKNRDTIH